MGDAFQELTDLSLSTVSTRAALMVRRKALEALLRAFTKSANEEIASLSHTINSHSPIHLLPVELLMKVWFYVLPSGDDAVRPGAYYDTLHALAQVSKSWASILRCEQQLWTFINGGDSWDVVTAAIRRSEGRPLTVVIPNPRTSGSEFATPNDPSTGRPVVHWLVIAERIEQFCQTMPRWQELSLFSPASVHRTLWTHLQLKELSAPNLQSLVLGNRSIPDEHRSPLFGGETPALGSLQIRNSALNRDCSLLKLVTGLRSLELMKVTMLMPPAQFLALLQQCPRLMAIKLVDTNLADNAQKLKPVILVSLRSMHLESLTPRTLTFLLTHIHSPQCDSFKIISDVMHRVGHVTKDSDVCDMLSSRISRWAKSAAKHMELYAGSTASPAISLQLSTNAITIQSIAPYVATFSIKLDVQTADFYVRWLVKLVDQMPGMKMALTLADGYHCTSPDLLQSLTHMKAVTTLQFNKEVNGASSFLRRLSKPRVMREGARAEWLLPNLNAIHFNGISSDFEEGLLRLVDIRYEETRAKVAGFPARPMPAGLWYILFEDVRIDDSTFEKLIEAVGVDRILIS